MAEEPLTVSFTIAEGDVWTDPEGIAWHVVYPDGLGAGVLLERTETHQQTVEPLDLVRSWRQVHHSVTAMTEPHPPEGAQ